MKSCNLCVAFVLLVSFAGSVQAEECLGWIGVDSGSEMGAMIVLDGKETGQVTPVTLKGIPCGKHTIGISKPFYKGGKKVVVVKSGEVAKVSIDMRANFGSLSVESTPSEAVVKIDGRVDGTTPLTVKKIEAGEHTVWVAKADFGEVRRKIVVRPKKKTRLKVSLEPEFGQVQIAVKPNSSNDEVMVNLDGDQLGHPPLTLKRIAPGSHKLTLTSPLYKAIERKIKVVRGKTTRVEEVLIPNYGTLVIQTKPAGSQILVDQKVRGQSPLEIRLAIGAHRIQAVDKNHSDLIESRRVVIKAGTTQKLLLTLPVKTGSLMVDSIPFAASIEIDGKNRGRAPLSIKHIPIGKHSLVARKKGFPRLVGHIDVIAQKRSVAEMNLKDPSLSTYRTPMGINSKKAEDGKTLPSQGGEKQTRSTNSSDEASKPITNKPTKATVASKTVIKPRAGSMNKEANTNVSAKSAAPLSTQRILAWSTAGLAAATGAAACVLGVMWGITAAEADEAYEAYQAALPNADDREYRDLDQKAAQLGSAFWISLGVGTAIGAAAVWLFVTEPEPEVDVTGPEFGLRFGPFQDGAWIGLQSRF